jgi:chromosome partitioning protein
MLESSATEIDPEIAQLVANAHSRPRGSAHVIVFANEKGGVGKSTLAFHAAVALANAGATVLALDCDTRQRSLNSGLENRRATMTCLGIALPCPRSSVVERPGLVSLTQEMARLGSGCRFILIDAPGHDSPSGRAAIALADTLVTPVNPSFVDLAHLGRFNPATMTLTAPGPFGALVASIQQERARQGIAAADWLLLKNRVRTSEMRQQERVDHAIALLAEHLGARVGSGFTERVGYRELVVFGLTHPDLARIPQLGAAKARDTQEVERLLAELRLPPMEITNPRGATAQTRVLAQTRSNYLTSLKAHVAPQGAGLRARA